MESTNTVLLHVHLTSALKLSAERSVLSKIAAEGKDTTNMLGYMSNYLYNRDQALISSLVDSLNNARYSTIDIKLTTLYGTTYYSVIDLIFTINWLKELYNGDKVRMKIISNIVIVLDKLLEAMLYESELQ